MVKTSVAAKSVSSGSEASAISRTSSGGESSLPSRLHVLYEEGHRKLRSRKSTEQEEEMVRREKLEEKEFGECTFTPRTKWNLLAERRRNSQEAVPRREAYTKEESLLRQRKWEENDLKECTFTPRTKWDLVAERRRQSGEAEVKRSSPRQTSQRLKQELRERALEEEQLKHCTFKPRTKWNLVEERRTLAKSSEMSPPGKVSMIPPKRNGSSASNEMPVKDPRLKESSVNHGDRLASKNRAFALDEFLKIKERLKNKEDLRVQELESLHRRIEEAKKKATEENELKAKFEKLAHRKAEQEKRLKEEKPFCGAKEQTHLQEVEKSDGQEAERESQVKDEEAPVEAEEEIPMPYEKAEGETCFNAEEQARVEGKVMTVQDVRETTCERCEEETREKEDSRERAGEGARSNAVEAPSQAEDKVRLKADESEENACQTGQQRDEMEATFRPEGEGKKEDMKIQRPNSKMIPSKIRPSTL